MKTAENHFQYECGKAQSPAERPVIRCVRDESLIDMEEEGIK